jgi:hypothetical protein
VTSRTVAARLPSAIAKVTRLVPPVDCRRCATLRVLSCCAPKMRATTKNTADQNTPNAA